MRPDPDRILFPLRWPPWQAMAAAFAAGAVLTGVLLALTTALLRLLTHHP